jgi:hypothetical protein
MEQGRKYPIQVKHLLKLLPSLIVICAWCQRVRLGSTWYNLDPDFEKALKELAPKRVTHGVCEDCKKKLTAGHKLDFE